MEYLLANRIFMPFAELLFSISFLGMCDAEKKVGVTTSETYQMGQDGTFLAYFPSRELSLYEIEASIDY